MKVISTFSGCGGSSLGYQLAGGKVLLAVECDDNAVATYGLNFPTTPIYHGDICQLSVEQCLEMAGVGPGELDVLDGSPPCQGFSTAGRRDFGDQRNQLFREYCRLLKGIQPKAFVMENVSGMVKGGMKLIFAECLRELKACGYRVKARLLNAQWFGVPQSRQRMIFIGIREDIGVDPIHPGPTVSRPITVREAFKGLTQTEDDLREPIALATMETRIISKWIPRLLPGQNLGDIHPTGAGFNLYRLKWDGVCPTIMKSFNGGQFCGIVVPDENRWCSVPELRRLASFPDNFQFAGDLCDAVNRIGNTVPPLFMRAIAETVFTTIKKAEVACGS